MKCNFCSIIVGQAPATLVRSWPDVIAIRPLNPVTAGHLLVFPHRHVADLGEAPDVSGCTMAAAAELAAGLPAANVITSKAAAATQSQFHLHLHVEPRNEDDALSLPWTPQRVGTGR
jgi:histidine triad (HIT) family protein